MHDEILGPYTAAPAAVDRAASAAERALPHLTCDRCGMRYGQAAARRQLTLVAGACCRRCGGTLQPRDRAARTARVSTVLAVRSAFSERDGVPFA
jgi:hypothetical protein